MLPKHVQPSVIRIISSHEIWSFLGTSWLMQSCIWHIFERYPDISCNTNYSDWGFSTFFSHPSWV